MKNQRIWNVLDLIQRTTEYFRDKNIENPRLNAEQLLGHVLQKDRVQLYLAFERPVTENELSHYRELVKRRAQHEPLQYILGSAEFMDCQFIVKSGVLIPRPETELLVEETSNIINQLSNKKLRILDIGTGSGCIAISLKKLHPDLQVWATDISTEALEIAMDNSILNNLPTSGQSIDSSANKSIQFVEHDIMTPLPPDMPKDFDILVSNPPYISREEMPGLPSEVREFEPATALTDQSDGLSFYKHLFMMVSDKQIVTTRYLLIEMTGTQFEKIKSMAQTFSFDQVEIVNDLNRIPRVIKIKV